MLKGDSHTEYTADALIIATGAKARYLGLPSEQHFMGYGVSACATCDGFFYRGKKVIVVGGGNTAVEEALYLANIASQVILVHRRGVLRSEKILQERLFANKKIDIMWNYELDEVTGHRQAALRHRRQPQEHADRRDRACPDRRHLHRHRPRAAKRAVQGPDRHEAVRLHHHRAALDRDQHSRACIAAGDVADDVYRQAVTAAGLGCMAALEAEKHLAGLDTLADAAE